ncbi:MAG: GH1 family beta-glucosidase, partial [Solirubrobacteraceae bacterium]
GAATAAYQVEGAAREDGRGESIWDRFSHTPGKTLNGDTGDIACDHYHRWLDDVALLRELGLNAYRLSISWPRVLPDGRGPVNEAGLAFYERLIDALLAAGITPWVTLYHWDLPWPLEERGGWPARDTAKAFAEYADVVSRRLGDRVTRWITLNEPWCSAFLGYHTGEHAPGLRNLAAAVQATQPLLLAHGMAIPAIRRNSPGAKVGITLNLTPVYPSVDDEACQAAAVRQDGYFNRWFLDPLYGRGYPRDMRSLYGELAPTPEPGDLDVIATPTDFLGVNYYSPAFVRDDPPNHPWRVAHTAVPAADLTDLGWPVYPRGLYDLLRRLHRDYPTGPLYVTENGAAYDDPAPESHRVD